MRRSYERGELDEQDAGTAPLALFQRWFEQARAQGSGEANAMTLATVGPQGRPSTRVVLAKDVDQRGITWYTNYPSRKGEELAANPYAAVQFFWSSLERVVRVEGKVEQIPAEESDAYFAERPLDSRIGAWASPQSQVIPSRATLVTNAAAAAAQHGLRPPRPPHWGGYRLVPDLWEFWQGRASRLHDRIRYRRSDGQWVRERLAP